MDLFGTRLRKLRQKKGWTVNYFAEQVGCSDKSILRYEKNQSHPDTFILVRLSFYLEASADYLLGLSDRVKPYAKQQELFRQLDSMFTNEIEKDCNYYWISCNGDILSDTFNYGGQTKWIGFTDTTPPKELRVLREVDPEDAISMCTKVEGMPMIVNKISHLSLYLQFGGEAIIKESIVREHLPFMLEPFVVNIGFELENIAELENRRRK